MRSASNNIDQNLDRKTGSEAFTDYWLLADIIQNLRPPAKGYLRVFRGQTRHYETMLPSGLRWNLGADASLFNIYAAALVADLTHGKRAIEDMALWFVWLQALAQHYGAGSKYLDVTKSLEVALWFALHQFETVESKGIMGQCGPYDAQCDDISNAPWCRYTRAYEPGYIYVFDVPKWDGKGLPRHGMVVDLTEAPGIIAGSTRINVQKGCALFAQKNVDGGNLASFLACSPVRVSWPMAGISLPASADQLFPLPQSDDWYARFISAPLLNRLDSKTSQLELMHPVAVNLHLPDRLNAIPDVNRRVISITPRLLWPTLVSSGNGVRPAFFADRGENQELEKATPIVLQSPLCGLTPPLKGADWNHGLLAGDAAKYVTVDDLEAGGLSHGVSLCNVFMEFSPLEKTGWERVEKGDCSIIWLRGLWVISQDQEYEIRAWFQSFEGNDSALAYTDPMLVTLDPSTKRFRSRTTKSISWDDFSETQSEIAKSFFVTLMILRELTPLMKATPFPKRTYRDKNGKSLTEAGLRRAAAKLGQTRDPRSGHIIYLVQEIGTGNIFVRPKVATGRYLEEGESWATADAGTVRKWIAEEAFRQSYEIGNKSGPERAITSYYEMIREFEIVGDPNVKQVVAKARYNRGVTLQQAGRSDEAITEYDMIFAAARGAPELAMQEMGARALLAKADSLLTLGRVKEMADAYWTLLVSFGKATAPEMQPFLNEAREALSRS